MIYHLPDMYYSGHRDLKSDLGFIQKHIDRLNEHNQKIVAFEYGRIFSNKLASGDMSGARKAANTYLKNFADEFGISAKEIKEITTSTSNRLRVMQMIEQAKKAQKAARPSIF